LNGGVAGVPAQRGAARAPAGPLPLRARRRLRARPRRRLPAPPARPARRPPRGPAAAAAERRGGRGGEAGTLTATPEAARTTSWRGGLARPSRPPRRCRPGPAARIVEEPREGWPHLALLPVGSVAVARRVAAGHAATSVTVRPCDGSSFAGSVACCMGQGCRDSQLTTRRSPFPPMDNRTQGSGRWAARDGPQADGVAVLDRDQATDRETRTS
jgi:hypothetical protein